MIIVTGKRRKTHLRFMHYNRQTGNAATGENSSKPMIVSADVDTSYAYYLQRRSDQSASPG